MEVNEVLSLCCHNAVRVLSQCCQSDSKLNVFKYIRQVAIGTWRLAKTEGKPFIPLIHTDDTEKAAKRPPTATQAGAGKPGQVHNYADLRKCCRE
jgi:hypothetical protein